MEWGDLGRWAMEVEVEDLGGGRRVFCIAKYKWGTTLQTVLLLCNDPEEPPPNPNGVGIAAAKAAAASHCSAPDWTWTSVWVRVRAPSPAINCCILLSLCGCGCCDCGNEADKRRRRLVYYTARNGRNFKYMSLNFIITFILIDE